MGGFVEELIDMVSNLSANIRPDILSEFGLPEACQCYFERYTKTTGINVEFKHNLAGERFPEIIEVTAYRIIQEALSNAARHAGVDKVSVSLDCHGERMHVAVSDQGKGFNPVKLESTAFRGITGMRDRAYLAGGELEVQSEPGRGTIVICRLPLHDTFPALDLYA
jgi:signal transduction histidine kinase